MNPEDYKTVSTADGARALAIDWQTWASEQSPSYGELAEWQALFEMLGKKFNLTSEFRENGIL